jgi:hypothetical protein
MKTHSPAWDLTPNLYLTRNESDIIDCLVDHHEMPTDFEENHVISFFNDTDLHLVLYFSKQGDKGFQMYVIKDFSVHVKDMILLRELFGRLIEDGLSVLVLQKAQYRIDHIISMSGTFRAMLHHNMADHVEDN